MNTDPLIDQISAEFETHELADLAIQRLTQAHLDVKNLSIIGRDYHTEEQPVGYINTGDRMLAWGKFGAFWGSIWGVLVGSAIIFVPGVGSVLLAGWLVATVVAALDGAALGGGLGAISAALYSIGIPKDSVLQYERAIEAGRFVVLVRGSAVDVDHAKSIFASLGATGVISSEQRVLEKV